MLSFSTKEITGESTFVASERTRGGKNLSITETNAVSVPASLSFFKPVRRWRFIRSRGSAEDLKVSGRKSATSANELVVFFTQFFVGRVVFVQIPNERQSIEFRERETKAALYGGEVARLGGSVTCHRNDEISKNIWPLESPWNYLPYGTLQEFSSSMPIRARSGPDPN